MDEIALSFAETESRFKQRHEYLERALGYHATAEGIAFYKECVPRIATFLRDELKQGSIRKPQNEGKTRIPPGLAPVLSRLKDPELIAVSALTALTQSPAFCPNEDCKYPRHTTFEQLGAAIHGECLARRRRVFTSTARPGHGGS